MNHIMVQKTGMKSITIHNLDNTLAKLLKEEADQNETSLNQTIKRLLQQSLGVSKQLKKHDFSEFRGVWNRKEFDEFENSIKDFERIDSQDWR